ncbi:ferritin-like domain-containing protein [Stappia indica]|uniref:ferritin-like domain-containing protein n=1 Tax=Stappia indica TaxID=538381 RepID=UPI00082EF82B|nr:ferritin-like domain-containing protein [Stappia indica]
MTDMNETLNQWLRDAHAMEEQAEQMLDSQASRLESYPELASRIRQHLEETHSQRERLESCIERRGASSSSMKDMAARLSALMQGMSSMMSSDEVMKGLLTSYAFEHFEVASYRILTAAAEAVGDSETARMCEAICKEEEAMASWLAGQIPEVTRTYLSRESADMDEAKR